MKNVIAYSLWGDAPMYWVGALENIKLAKLYFPGWICRFYIDKNCERSLIDTIVGDNVEVILIDPNQSFFGMFWRFYAAADKDVNIMLSRDTDSRFSNRELTAINEWLNSNKDFHIMRDHPHHTVPILGGMWGVRNGLINYILDDISKWTHFDIKGCDQDFLGQIIYPKIINNAIEHIDFNMNFGGNVKPFPTIRNDYEFVGDVFDENNKRHPEYWKLIKQYHLIYNK